MGQFWRGRQWPTSTLCPAMRELTSRNANVLRYSESAADLLVDNGSNFAIFSECALISKEKLSDFDSVIRRFESSRPSQLIYLIAIEFFTSRFPGPFHSETSFRCRDARVSPLCFSERTFLITTDMLP
jgi:hypothetical protein